MCKRTLSSAQAHIAYNIVDEVQLSAGVIVPPVHGCTRSSLIL